jgi:hypothetical protein
VREFLVDVEMKEGGWSCQRDLCSLILKENQTSCFLEVYLALQMVLLFMKPEILQPRLPWEFCSQQLVPIKSRPAFYHQQVFQEAERTESSKMAQFLLEKRLLVSQGPR